MLIAEATFMMYIQTRAQICHIEMNGIMFHCAWLQEHATLFFLHSYASDLASFTVQMKPCLCRAGTLCRLCVHALSDIFN